MNGDKNFEGMRIAGKGAWLLWFPFILFAWSPPVNISNTESLSTYPSMCIDRRGWLHVVWEEREGRHEVYYTFFTGDTWGIPVNISNDSNYSVRPDVAVDTLNRVHVVWCDWPPGRILWCYMEGGIWSSPVCISESIQADNEGPELVVNPLDNTVHCVWHGISGTESVIWYSFWDGESWSIPENISSLDGYGAWADIAVDSLGSLHVVWMDYGTEDIFYSCRDGTTWSSPVNISNLSGQSCAPRIAIDRDNNPHVVWEERENGYQVYYSYFNGNGWVTPIWVDSLTAATPDISVRKDTAYIVYSQDYDVFYTVYRGSSCVLFPMCICSTGGALCTRIEANAGLLHVVWQDASVDSSVPIKNIEIFYISGKAEGFASQSFLSSGSFVVIKYLYLPFSGWDSVTIYDIAGRKVMEIEREVMRGIEMKMPSGVYFLEVRRGNVRFWYRLILLNP